MKTLYALPCTCGKSVDVDRSQAGLAVRCACGRELEVPTIRGLANLESRVDSQVAPASTWGPRQGVMFLGVAIALLAGATASYVQFLPPPSPVRGIDRAAVTKLVDSWTPTQTFEAWAEMSQGMERSELPTMMAYWDVLARRQRWAWVAWAVVGVGVAIALVGALMPKSSPEGRPRRAPQRKV